MRLSAIKTVFRKEVRELMRDRRSLMIMFGIPLVLYPLLTVGIGGLAQSKAKEMKKEAAKVFFFNAADAPQLAKMAVQEKYSLQTAAPPDAEAALKTGNLQAIVDVPADAEKKLLAADGGGVGESAPTFQIRVDRSRSGSGVATDKVETLLHDYETWIIQQRLAAKNIAGSVLTPIQQKTIDIATGDQRLGRLLSQMLPVLLLVTGMLGALFPALSATTTERELGTLETLLVSPVSRMELLTAKGLLVLSCGMITAAMNLCSMSGAMWFIASQGGKDFGTVSISPVAIALAYLAAVPSLLVFTSLVLVVGLVARTYREANSFATPVMMLPMIAMGIAIMDPPTSTKLLLTPVASTTVIIRDVLVGRAHWNDFALVAVSSLVYAGLILSVAVRLFSNEQLVNPSWEPMSMKGLKKRGSKRKLRLPTIDEAVAILAVFVLLNFYVSPMLFKKLMGTPGTAVGFWKFIIANQFLVVAWPAMMLTWLGRLDRTETFALRKPHLGSLGGAALLAVGMVPLALLFNLLQHRVFPVPPSENTKHLAEMLQAGMTDYPAVTAVVVGLAAGICEEILFRGIVLRALLKRFPVWFSVGVCGLVFAVLHFDAGAILVRTLLGICLGWITVRSRSILPAILCHALYDCTTILIAAVGTWYPKFKLEDFAFSLPGMGVIAIGAALVAAGFAWVRYSPPATEPLLNQQPGAIPVPAA